ncbi:ScbA/BarX family gamma-butyrolactone biosynthesis protein [Streptomyces yangpuensis]|uniref:ScbA/BarX family gamma-butyrolactone biosynthesis protein n=1 Tax=Streptomyces yangpuensis TaxID=1648182 RepID=UPI0037F75377
MTAITFRVDHPTPSAQAHGGRAFIPRQATGSRFPTLTATVPKELVHRAAVAEVMLTDWQRLDDTHFKVSAQWPRGHSFFTPIGGEHHDPLIAAETMRQIGPLLGHAEFGVPLGHQFVLWDLDIAVAPPNMRVGSAPAALDIEVTCTEIKQRGRHLSGLRILTVFRRDGQIAATGTGSFSCLAPGVYQRIRGEHARIGDRTPLPLTAPALPQSVGRTSPMDVVLSPIGEPARWQLRADTRHPVLFDHAVDHIPGMVLLEAARQATAAVLGRSTYIPHSISSEFHRYAELDSPCFIEARRLPRVGCAGQDSVLVTGHQDDALVFSSTVTTGTRDL